MIVTMPTEIQRPSATSTEFQVLLTLAPVDETTPEVLEGIADAALDALVDGAADVALGVVVGADYVNCAVEIECTVEAASASDVHDKIKTIIGVLEDHAQFELRESNAQRLEPALACA